MRSLCCALLVAGALAHGVMNTPPTRNQDSFNYAGQCRGDDITKVPQNGTCLWFNQGCQIGCKECSGGNCVGGQKCCDKPMKQTLPKEAQTYTGLADDFSVQYNPWRAPGYAPIIDPCGIAGGFKDTGAPGNGGYPPTGVKQGAKGSAMPPAPGKRTVWKAGTVHEVAWDLVANHGGGYQYRLCPKGQEQYEECFQKTPLEFVGNKQWLQWGSNSSLFNGTRKEISALRVSGDAVYPKGSTWTRNPIPACKGPEGGALYSGCDGPQFEPPLKDDDEFNKLFCTKSDGTCGVGIYKRPEKGLYGFGAGTCTSGLPGKSCTDEEIVFWATMFNFNIIDQVAIPKDLKTGEYVLSFRWDCEQTPQIWANCADVTIA